VVREAKELAAPGELQLGLNCRIRKTYSNADGTTQMVSTNGQLVMRDGDVVAVKVSTRFSHRYLGLTSFLKEARADEMALATLGGGSDSLKYCPCFEWEGSCRRCRGDMAQLGVHHPERKVRVNVVDHVRGIDAWVPLYLYAAHQLLDLAAFCKVAGVVTATPMHVIKIQVGGQDLPDGWRVEFAAEGYTYRNYILNITQDRHPTAVDKGLHELGLSQRKVRASSHQELSASVTAHQRGRASRIGPTGRWQVGTSQRPRSAASAVQALSEALGHPLSQSSTALNASATKAVAKPKRKKVAKRVYKAVRTIPPYSHAAWSSAMLLQSVFRGHTQRVLLLVTRRLQPTFEMPIRIASLAHTMVQMPTCFKMFKRLLLNYKRSGRGLRIPSLDTFRWPNARELEYLRETAILLQCAYRQHLGVVRLRERIYERAEKAKIENIIKVVQHEFVGQVSTVDATMSVREGLTSRPGSAAPQKDVLSTHLDLDEAEELWLHSITNCPIHKDNVAYLASRDGWDPAVFRDLCNDKHNLLFLIASSSPAHGGGPEGKGRTTHIFGAYTAIPWQRHGGFKRDDEAFLFSLRAAGPGGAECEVPPVFALLCVVCCMLCCVGCRRCLRFCVLCVILCQVKCCRY